MNKKIIVILLAVIFFVACFVGLAGYFFLGGLIDFVSKPADIGLQTLPCEPASRIELGYPLSGQEAAEFTTNGDPMYVTARKFDHTGILDPQKWVVAVYIGHVSDKPIWDKEKRVATNAIQKIIFSEGNYGKIDLPSGRYWLWSAAGDVAIFSCEPNGVSDPKSVR